MTQNVTQGREPMKYLIQRNGWYTYNRRIPNQLKPFDNRERVRVALNTKCETTAMKKMVVINDEVENYWKTLIKNQKEHSKSKFRELVLLSKQLGFTYMPTNRLLDIPLTEVLERIFSVKKFENDPQKTKALLGDDQNLEIPLSEALKRFFDYSKPTLMKKNRNQQRKWKSPREKAVNNFINQIGDKNILKITNLDLVNFRDWWITRINRDGLKTNSANKDLSNLKNIIETVSTHEQLGVNVDLIFKKIRLKQYDEDTRNSYESDYIQNSILDKEVLKNLDIEAQNILYASIGTGARPIELVNLHKEDIFLDVDIPYIHIRPRKGYSLKTMESERKLPIVGNALEAFKNYPDGFIHYGGNADNLCLKVDKFLSKNDLRPTKKHSFYSFRHSFQDRLNALELPDRIQCQLMGHKFNHPKYGKGVTLEHLQKIMLKIDLS